MTQRNLSLVTASLATVFVAARAHAAPPPAHTEAAITAWVFGGLDHVGDAPLACAWPPAGAPTCVTGASHLTFVAESAIPHLTGCQEGTVALRACYLGAVTQLQRALEGGDVLTLVNAAYRTKDVLDRALKLTTAPLWLRTAGPSNLLAQFFSKQGIDLTKLGACRIGAVEARYACLAGKSSGPPAAVFRAAIGALDRHNDILINAGRLKNAPARTLAILRGATAPTLVSMVEGNVFDPRRGPGIQRVDLLGKLYYLRALMGAVSTSRDEELAYLGGLTAYQPAGAAPPTAKLVLFGAQRAAAHWDGKLGRVIDSAAINGDLMAMYGAFKWTAALLAQRGQHLRSKNAQGLALELSEGLIAKNFDDQGATRFQFGWGLVASDELISAVAGYADTCGWFTLEDVYRSMVIVWTETHTETITYQIIEDIGPCDPSDPDCQTVTYTEVTEEVTWTETHTDTVQIYLGQEVVTTSLREGYLRLLDADDGRFIDTNSDGVPDINHEGTGAAAASMAAAGVEATDCLAELATLSGAYQSEIDEASCADGSDCEDNYAPGTAGARFLPYAMAVRLCPNFTAEAIGLNRGYFVTKPIILPGGAKFSARQNCTLPYPYVREVSFFMDTADPLLLAEVDAADDGINRLLTDFAAEGLLLTTPLGGVYRQRADLAYFSSEHIATACGDTSYDDCTGLNVQAARLDQAASAVGKGLVLFARFAGVDWTINGAVGAEAIPVYAAAGLTACASCDPNSEDELRALFYKRLRDTVVAYHRIQDDRIENLWRRLDGMDRACALAEDTDGDGDADRYICDDTNVTCDDFCGHFDDLGAVVDDVVEDMTEVAGLLAEHVEVLDRIGAAELSAFVGDLAFYAQTIASAAPADQAAFLAGVDWLGERSGRWRVAPEDDAGAQVDAAFAELEVEAAAFAADYDGYVAGYYQDLSTETAFASTVVESAATTESRLADYCYDLSTGAAATGGCGNDGAAWTAANAAAANAALAEHVCGLTAELDGDTYEIGLDFLDPADAGDAQYLDWVDGAGMPRCPEAVAPDIAGLQSTYGGALVDELEGIRQALFRVELAAQDFANYVQMTQNVSAIFDEYENYFDIYENQQAWKEWIADAVICGGAALGAALTTAAAAAATVASAGAVAPLGAWGTAAVWSGAIAVCSERLATGTENLFPDDGNISSDDLNFAATYTSQLVTETEQLYQTTVKLEAVLLAVADYQAAALSYQNRLAAFRREIALANTTFDALTQYQPWMDPTYLMFENQELQNLRDQHRDLAGTLQAVHRLIEYDIGNPVPLGGTYPRRTSETYCLPSLAELTILSSYGASVSSAYQSLETTADCATLALGDPAALNLVAAASLLVTLYDDFREVYGDRFEVTAYVGSSLAGIEGLDNDGEGAMLADSRFYDARGETASGCAEGRVDLSDYCAVYADTGNPVPRGACADISATDPADRLNLAHLDHMLRGEGVATFECNRNPGDARTVAVGNGGALFTAADLGRLNSSGGAWARGIEDTFEATYYDAQTAVVRGLLDRYLDGLETADEDGTLSTDLRVYPGNFIYQVDMSSAGGGSGTSNAGFEPEADLLYNAAAAPSSQAEQIEGIGVICTTAWCAEGSQHYAGLVLFGEGYQGTRCRMSKFIDASGNFVLAYPDGTSRQEQIEYLMDDSLALNAPAWSYATTTPESSTDVEELLADETASSVGNRPLHPNSMLVVVGGVYDANQHSAAEEWPLYYGSTTEPRLRLAIRYSYYSTESDAGASNLQIESFLPCGNPDLAEAM